MDSEAGVAFVGAGGKTTAIFQLARQLNAPVIVTATSHLGKWQLGFADRHIITQTSAPIEELAHGLTGITLITGELDGDRTKPINDALLHWLNEFCSAHSIALLIEADGSRQKPVKAWASHEPPIPSFIKHVVQVAGLSAVGKPLSDEFVHRPELFSKISGLHIGNTITPAAMTQVLTHAEAGLKNIPSQAKRTVLLTQTETPHLQSMAHGMAGPLLRVYQSVIVANLSEPMIYAVEEPIAGIVLAAGQSLRFGAPKQLLDWHGQPFVRAVSLKALESGLSPVVVVTGAHAEKVETAISNLDVRIVHNTDWARGQGSSIKTGMASILSNALESPLRAGVGGAVFLLADQPQITTSVIRALVEKHAEGLYPIVAPMVIDQRANPVLFDQRAFGDLLAIEGDVGGRAIFHKHRVEYLPWHDDRLLLDVDTPEMYQRLLADETL
jgi:molybdenum cofactor cytidylyltransferase